MYVPRRPLAPVPRRGRRRDQRFPRPKLRFAWIVALDQGGLTSKSRKDAAWTAVSLDVLSNDPAQSRWRWGRWPSAGVSGRESSSLHARDALIGQKAAPEWQQVDCCWSNTRAAATDQSRDLLSPRQLNGRCINRSTWGVCLQVLGQHLLTAHMQMVHVPCSRPGFGSIEHAQRRPTRMYKDKEAYIRTEHDAFLVSCKSKRSDLALSGRMPSIQ